MVIGLVKCPFCHTRVIPMSPDNKCPSCQQLIPATEIGVTGEHSSYLEPSDLPTSNNQQDLYTLSHNKFGTGLAWGVFPSLVPFVGHLVLIFGLLKINTGGDTALSVFITFVAALIAGFSAFYGGMQSYIVGGILSLGFFCLAARIGWRFFFGLIVGQSVILLVFLGVVFVKTG